VAYRRKAERLALVGSFKDSGLTQRAFAAVHRVSVGSLRRWVHEAGEAGPSELVRFVEVTPTLTSSVQVTLPSGVQLEVPCDVPGSRVRELAEALC
jgi:hypothetical protein